MSFQNNDKEPFQDFAVSTWYTWIDSKPGYVVLDGGLGSILSERGNDLSQGSMWSGRLLCVNPEELGAVAWSWLSAGADIITTATYQVSEDLLRKEFGLCGEKAEHVIFSGWSILDSARKHFWSSLSSSQRLLRRYPKIAISLGPFSAVREDTDEYSGLYENVAPDDFRHFHHRRAMLFARHLGPRHTAETDILCYETIGNPSEAVAIAETMSGPQLRNMPYWMSFQCRDASRLASGASLSSVVHDVLNACRHRNLIAIGVNCVDVRHAPILIAAVKTSLDSFMALNIQRSWRIDTITYPNSGESWCKGCWIWPSGKPLSPPSWASILRSSHAKVLGGCCRTSPAHISALNLMRHSEASDSKRD